MSARPDAMTHFHSVACVVLGNDNCFPVVQPSEKDAGGQDIFKLPALVYYALSPETVSTLAGPCETALAMRYEARATDYDGAVELSGQVLSALRAGGRLTRIGAGVDDYDEALEIYRRIQSVTLRR